MNDITARRHRGNAESAAAFQAIKEKMPRSRMMVFGKIRRSGDRGMTCEEVGRSLRLLPHMISGRFTELKRDKMIVPTGATRLTQAGHPARVYKAR